jgi:hypothetical protein
MKALLAFLALGVITASGLAQFPITTPKPAATPAPAGFSAAELHNASTIEIGRLDEKPFDYNDKLVRIHVEGRTAKFTTNDKGGISGRIGAQLNYEWFYLDAEVPEAGKAWFTKLPINTARPGQYVYARITYDGKKHTAHLLGREARFGIGDPVLLW